MCPHLPATLPWYHVRTPARYIFRLNFNLSGRRTVKITHKFFTTVHGLWHEKKNMFSAQHIVATIILSLLLSLSLTHSRRHILVVPGLKCGAPHETFISRVCTLSAKSLSRPRRPYITLSWVRTSGRRSLWRPNSHVMCAALR